MSEVAPHVLLLEKLMDLLGLVDKHGHSLVPQHILYTWLVMLILICLAWLGTRRLSMVPRGLQNFWEIIVGGMEDFVCENMGPEGGRVFPLLMTLFIFLLSNNFFIIISKYNNNRDFVSVFI